MIVHETKRFMSVTSTLCTMRYKTTSRARLHRYKYLSANRNCNPTIYNLLTPN